MMLPGSVPTVRRWIRALEICCSSRDSSSCSCLTRRVRLDIISMVIHALGLHDKENELLPLLHHQHMIQSASQRIVHPADQLSTYTCHIYIQLSFDIIIFEV